MERKKPKKVVDSEKLLQLVITEPSKASEMLKSYMEFTDILVSPDDYYLSLIAEETVNEVMKKYHSKSLSYVKNSNNL
jgi:hypothetical protein